MYCATLLPQVKAEEETGNDPQARDLAQVADHFARRLNRQ